MCLYEYMVPAEVRRDYQIPWNWIPGSCALPDMGAGNQTGVLWKSRAESSCLFSPHFDF